MKNDFYIGWQPTSPDFFAKKTRHTVVLILALTAVVAAALVLPQRGFEKSTFEFGTLSTLEGVLVTSPAPMLKTIQPDSSVQGVLLVGFGKMGAEKDLEKMAAEQGRVLENETIKLEGTKIYHNGKMLLELTNGAAAFSGFSPKKQLPEIETEQFGEVSLRGEILDPKCALGVMKPGEGKPHRSCAVRCISGGIPPVFRITNPSGQSNYCLLKGRDGRTINAEVLDFVADQVRLCGRLERQGDWLVLHTEPSEEILRLQPYWMGGEVPLCSTNGD